MLSKILGFRRVLASAVSKRHQHGPICELLVWFVVSIFLIPSSIVKSLYPPTGKQVTSGGQVLVTTVRFCAHRCDAHMNELPVPCMPWEPWYSDKQSFYNKVLLGGILWFLFSLGMMIWTDSIFLNWAPPKNPGPPSDMVEECEED